VTIRDFTGAALSIALSVLGSGAARAADEEAVFVRPYSERSLALSFDGQRYRERGPGGATFGDGSLAIRGSTALAGSTRVAGEDFSAWGLAGEADARYFTPDLPDIEGDARFLRLGAAVSAIYAPSARNAFRLQAGAFVAEQAKLLGSAQVHPRVLALGAHRESDRLRWLYGFGYTYSWGRGLPLPFLGVGWRFAPAWRLDVLAPVRASVTWSRSDRFSLSGELAVKGDQFRYDAIDASGAVSEQLLHIARVRLGVSGSHALSQGVRVELETGVERASVDTGLSDRKAFGGYLGASMVFGARSRFPATLASEP
jgi:Domain of unknown function (DUF6268)